MGCTPTIDVVDGKKLDMILTTTNTKSTTIGLENLDFKTGFSLFCILSKLKRVSLSVGESVSSIVLPPVPSFLHILPFIYIGHKKPASQPTRHSHTASR